MKINYTINAGKRRSGLSQRLFLLFIIFAFLRIPNASAYQVQADTILWSRQQYEELFLKQNLLLLAERYTIDQADALYMQAKLWPNPSLSIDDMNLWATKNQIAAMDGPLPTLFGSAAKNTQFSVELEQLIQTAGKRKKLMAVEQVSIDIAKQEFEDLLRTLKYQFRNNLSRLEFLQEYQKVFLKQQSSVQKLLKSYERQVISNNISHAEFTRLQVLSLELLKEINELSKERNEVEAEMKIFLNLDTPSTLKVKAEDIPTKITSIKKLIVTDLFNQALEMRPDLKIVHLENIKDKNSLSYEKSKRIPDLTLSGTYDRGGGIWPSFVGFGLAIDLPFFDRNQGSIDHAKLAVNKSEIMYREKLLRVKSEVMKNYKDLMNAIELYDSIKPDHEKLLDDLLISYTRNFTDRNISLLAYLDFQNAYLENKKIILESLQDVQVHIEELNHTIGGELN